MQAQALTSKARLRQHLLDGEQDIDTLSESLQQHQYQQQQQNPKYNRFQPAYMQQQQQQFMNVPGAVSHTNLITSASTTNYDIMTPLPTSGSPFTPIVTQAIQTLIRTHQENHP